MGASEFRDRRFDQGMIACDLLSSQILDQLGYCSVGCHPPESEGGPLDRFRELFGRLEPSIGVSSKAPL